MNQGRTAARSQVPTDGSSRRRVALLRGINVGGHRKVPMAELRTLLTDHVGLVDVATYIQSGNVVFSDGASSGEPGPAISRAIADHFGFDVPVVVRDVDVLVTLLARSAELFPVADAGFDASAPVKAGPVKLAPDKAVHDKPVHDKRVMVGFLTAVPTTDAVASIDADRSPGDSVTVEDDHAHIRYATGQSTTKLTGDYLERVLGVGMTTRNLATIRKLVDLA